MHLSSAASGSGESGEPVCGDNLVQIGGIKKKNEEKELAMAE